MSEQKELGDTMRALNDKLSTLDGTLSTLSERLDELKKSHTQVGYAAIFSIVGAALLSVGFAVYSTLSSNESATANQKSGWALLGVAGLIFIMQSAVIYLTSVLPGTSRRESIRSLLIEFLPCLFGIILMIIALVRILL